MEREQLNNIDNQPVFNINDQAYQILASRVIDSQQPQEFPKDAAWLRMSFNITSRQETDTENLLQDAQDVDNRTFSSAKLKYTDSSIGGNVCINPPVQFTRYCDIREQGFRQDAQDTSLNPCLSSLGMGRYYSEAIDDNNQIIHLRFGRPQYNSLTQFFTGFYSSKAASTARAGRFDDGFINAILRTTGTVIGLAVAPLFFIPMAVLFIGTAVKYFVGSPSSKFYTMKPTMPLYWSAVQGLVNQIGVNQGLIYPGENSISTKILGETGFDKASKENNLFARMLPNEFMENGGLNVYAIANKSKRNQMTFENNLKDAIQTSSDSGNVDSYGETIRQVLKDNSLLTKKAVNMDANRFSLESYLQRTFEQASDFFKQATDKQTTLEKDIRTSDNFDSKKEYVPKELSESVFNYFIASAADGSDWASFRVDYTGSVSESFSNSATESSLAGTFNSASKTAASARHNFADGNIDGMGVVKGVKEMLGHVVGAAASVLHVEGLFALAGNAFIDIPKNWDSSSANLPKSNYTITLTSPYGNPISQMFNIYLPLSMLLAGALPLSTGKQSYTSPFLCELHDRGRMMTRLGMIDSLSITRGTSNLGFSNDGKAMSIEVSFSVLDLSSIVSMPIRPEFSLMPLDGLFDSDNAFSDYLMAISGMPLGDTIYKWAMMKRQFKRIKADFNTFFSSAHFGTYAASLPVGQILSAFSRGTDKR